MNSTISLATGASFPSLGLGLWKLDLSSAAAMVTAAIEAGYRHLDGACDYGNEAACGEGLRAALSTGSVRREDVWVTSKLWNTFHRREHVRAACLKSLADWQLDYFDLYLIHFPIALAYVPMDQRYPPGWFYDPANPGAGMKIDPVPIIETWRALEELVDEGLVRHIGVSNFGCSLLRDLLSQARIRPTVLQIESHPYLVQSKLVRYCQQESIAVTAFSPLGAGSYVPLGMATLEQSVLNEPRIAGIAHKHGKSPAQIVLRWGVQRGTAVIPKTSRPDRLTENLNIYDFELSDEEMKQVASLDRHQRFNDPGVFANKPSILFSRSMSETNSTLCEVNPTSPHGPVVNIAAYHFVELTGLERLRDRLKSRCKLAGLRGTIMLSPEGINMFLAGGREGIDALLAEVRSIEGLANIEVKESYSIDQPFNRMLVKLKREIIAFGVEGIAPAKRTSPKLPPQELKRWLDEGRPVRLLDTRNDYEVDLGTFHGAERLNIQHFRDFPSASAQLPEAAKQEPLVMFCTGGIRCEKAGPMLEKLGFEQVYQLDGGILKYFEECGGAHYDGGCFVFDSRVVLGPDLQPTGAVVCYACQAVLTHEDIQSPMFRITKSCPHCYRTDEQAREEARARREKQIRAIAAQQPGCEPYDNCRRMHVPGRCSGLSLIDFLTDYHPPTAREQWLKWIDEGTITCGGKRVAADQLVREGQQFEQVESGYVEPAVASAIGLVYEDEALVVIDKPAPLPVHACGRFHRNTLEYFLSQVYRPEKLRLAHRLDANTTGLVVLARKYSVARVLQPQFAEGRVDKRYLLKVHGEPPAEQFYCDEPISPERGPKEVAM